MITHREGVGGGRRDDKEFVSVSFCETFTHKCCFLAGRLGWGYVCVGIKG